MGRIRELQYIADAFKYSRRQDRERRRRQRDKYRVAVDGSSEKKKRKRSDFVMDEDRLTAAVKSFPLICNEVERARKESQRSRQNHLIDETLKDVIEDRYVHPSDYQVVKSFLDTVVESVNETLLDHGMALDLSSKTFIVPEPPAAKKTTGDVTMTRSETAPAAAVEATTEGGNKEKKKKVKKLC